MDCGLWTVLDLVLGKMQEILFPELLPPPQRMEVLSQQPQNLLSLPQGLHEGSQALDFHFV